MEQPRIEQNEAVTVHGGATINGVQMDTQVIMQRKGYDKWPSATDGLKLWEEKVKQQDCSDHKMPFKELAISEKTGGLYRVGKNKDAAMAATKTAWNHLVSYIKDKPDSAVNNMLDMGYALRAARWEELKSRVQPREIVLRLAKSGINDQRVVRAVVSELHSQDKGDDLAIIQALRTVSDGLPAKLRVIRQWDYTSAELILPTVAKQVVKGNILYGRIALTNSETKGGKYETLAGSMVLTCLNGMTAPGNSSTFSVRHMGDISFRVRQSIKGAIEAVNDHLHTFAKAYETPLERTRADVLEAFGKVHKLPENTGAALAALWDVDGERSAGDTLAGLVNAVTRFAQSQPVEDALELERIAGETMHRGLSALL